MKKIINAIALVIVFLLAPIAHAQSSDWNIPTFDSKLVIQPDGKVLVTETITTQFNISKHGIYRDIPYEYSNSDGQKTFTNIVIQSVTQDGEYAKKTVTAENGYIRIKIGDPDKTITGSHTYIITYNATGILQSLTENDELYWNVTGNYWDTTIDKVTAQVTIPNNKIEHTFCYEGATGSRDTCASTDKTESTTTTFTTKAPIYPQQGFTIAVDYTKGTVPILIGTPPKRIETDILTPISLGTFVITLLLGYASIMRLWFRKGRDFWFRAPSQLDPNAKAESKPLGVHETTVVEFEPPEQLRPAEIGVLMDNQADTLDVTATLIDLATRGYLKITEEPKKWLFGDIDYILDQTKETDSSLRIYEKMLLNRLFSGTKSTKMSDLKLKFYQDLADIKQSLYKEVTEKKLYAGNPEKIRQKYLGIGIAILVFGGICIFSGIKLILGPLATLGGGILITGLGMMLASRFMPQRTAYGHELWQRSKGYYEFINGAEKYRQQFFEKKNMFNEILAYAIVFKLTGKFAKTMKDMGVEPSQPTWYAGSRPFNTLYFTSSVNDFSSSMSRAIAATPSSSGSGGSSGGGFGGGGGGSW
jgi:uncharacterized membrane protein